MKMREFVFIDYYEIEIFTDFMTEYSRQYKHCVIR